MSAFSFRFPLVVAAAAVLCAGSTGCDRVRNVFHKSHAQPSPTATPAATATPTPKSTPLAAATATPTATPQEPVKESANRDAGVIVLCYHRFEPNIKSPMSIPPKDFEAQMQALKDNGFTVISMQDFLAWRRDEKTIPAKSALITIDDGYASGYEVAWPILKKFGYPATYFVYTQYINSGGKSLSWDQLAALRDEGAEIGCHSVSHQSLKGRTTKAVQASQKLGGYEPWLTHEISDAKKVIEDNLGIKCCVFAYPEGVYNEKAREFVKKAGYEAAFAVYGRRNTFSTPPQDLIGRYAIESGKPKTFADALQMIGGGTPASYGGAELAPSVTPGLETTPAQGESVSDPKPRISAVLSSLGKVNPASVKMRISGFGLVNASYDAATQTVSYQPTTQPLRDKEYTVIVSAEANGKKAEARWSFQFAPAP